VVRFTHIKKVTPKIRRKGADKGKKTEITENLSRNCSKKSIFRKNSFKKTTEILPVL
jgi:hypothetical protein